MSLTPFQRSIEIIVLNAPDELTIAEIRDELMKLGWRGIALSDEYIQQALSELAITRVREA